MSGEVNCGECGRDLALMCRACDASECLYGREACDEVEPWSEMPAWVSEFARPLLRRPSAETYRASTYGTGSKLEALLTRVKLAFPIAPDSKKP